MVKRVLVLAMFSAISISMVGCASMDNVQKGMAIGALGGGAIGGIWGAQAGANLDAGEGMLVGAVTGATIGALVGDQMGKTNDYDALRKAISDKDAEIAKLQEEVRNMNTKLADANEKLAAAQRRIDDLTKQIADLQAELAKRAPRKEITLLSDVLFRPGSDQLSDGGKKALDDAVSSIKNEGSDKFIQIEGHTDSDPIKASNWKSNWELGAARSLAVLHYMLSKGVEPARLSAATFSQYQSVTSNDTAEGKSKNRRAVIVIYSNWK